jgi:NAD(P)-dependent dehydrogenase (short-subunit alcohol dehydrogenase family)
MTRVAVATGAGRGMGKACAVRLAADFDVVVVADLDRATAEQTAAELPDGKGRAFAVDVSDSSAVRALAEFAGSLGTFGGLAHAAAISPSMAGWDRVIDVDLRGTALMLETFEPLVNDGSAAVCFASSSAYMLGATPDKAVLDVLDEPLAEDLLERLTAFPQGPAAGSMYSYPWAKLAVIRLVGRAAVRWGPKGGRVVSVSPGIVDTPQSRQEAEGSQVMSFMLANTPLGRWGRPEEVAEFVAFALSDRASYLSGVDVLIDGGGGAGLAAAGGFVVGSI